MVNGRALVTVDENQHVLHIGDSITIPRLALHRVENTGKDTLRLIEVQNGDYLGEDDIERFDDDFGRATGEGKNGEQLLAKEEQGEIAETGAGTSAGTPAEQIYHRWLTGAEVDEQTKQELRSLRNNKAEIESRFGGELSFGTGGLRGIIGAGSRRMNVYVVRRAT